MKLYLYIVKPYTVQVDDKDILVTGETWVGKYPADDETIEVALFTNGEYFGSATITRQDIAERVEIVKEIV